MHKLETHSIEQFNRWARNYDRYLNSFTFRQTNEKIVSLLTLKNGLRILDVGCGTGILFEKLLVRNHNLKLFGIDIAPEMVKRARLKFSKRKNVQIDEGSVSKLPYSRNFFDFVICSSSFHHHPNPKQSIKEMVRVLKTEGQLIILDASLGGLIKQIFYKVENFINEEGEVNLFTKQAMFQLFQQNGLKNIHQEAFRYFALITSGRK